MADKYIARVKTTTALALAGLGDGHSAIATDGLYEHIHRVGSNFHFLTPDKYYNGATYAYNNREFNNVIIDGIATVGDNIRMQKTKKLMGANSAESAYRSLIGLDESNILKVGQDTDITAVTFGTTSELARLNSSGLGVGVIPSSSYWIYGVKNRNSGTINRIENTTNGSSAYTGMEICGDSGNNILLYQNSSSTTGTYCGLSNNGLSYISSTNVSGFIINSANNTPLHLASYGRIGITIIANGTLPNIGFGCTPSVMLHAESATTTSMLLKNTGNAGVQLSFYANLSAADASIGYIPYKWNGTAVAAIDCSTGADTMNKDDGYLIFKTATGGSLTQKMRLGYQLPIVEIGNPTTEDDATVWANTQTVLRVGTGLSILDFQSSSKSYPELLFNAQCTNPGVTYNARQTGRAYRIRGNCASTSGTFAINIVDDTSAGAAITWLSPIIITTTAVIIGQAFNLQLGNVAQAATQFTWDKYVTIKDMNGTTYYVPVCTGAPT